MAIDTNGKKLSLIDMDSMVFDGVPYPGGGLSQGDKQHLLQGYAGVLWDSLGEVSNTLGLKMTLSKLAIVMRVRLAK